MATIKSFTDLSQSKVLAEILPLESADMYWAMDEIPFLAFPVNDIVTDWEYAEENGILPAWSLAALMNALPEGTRLLKSTTDDTYHCDCPKENIDKWFDNPVDACYELIIKLHEQNLL